MPDSRQVLNLVQDNEIEVILLDLTMPHLSGQELLGRLRDGFPEIPVIIVTGTDEVGMAVECMRAGAFDYMVKVIEESRLISGVSRAMEVRNLRRGYRDLSRRSLANRPQHPEAFAAMLT